MRDPPVKVASCHPQKAAGWIAIRQIASTGSRRRTSRWGVWLSGGASECMFHADGCRGIPSFFMPIAVRLDRPLAYVGGEPALYEPLDVIDRGCI